MHRGRYHLFPGANRRRPRPAFQERTCGKEFRMLSWARPWALWLGLSVPAVVILYFLRTRWKSLPVGSTFIWRLLVDKNDGGRRLRRRSLL
ncbi:MAG: hypothetical protein E4H20_05450, partial [Spirochaetales bacterium]